MDYCFVDTHSFVANCIPKNIAVDHKAVDHKAVDFVDYCNRKNMAVDHKAVEIVDYCNRKNMIVQIDQKNMRVHYKPFANHNFVIFDYIQKNS